MKRQLSILLTTMLSLSISACSESDDTEKQPENNQQPEVQKPEEQKPEAQKPEEQKPECEAGSPICEGEKQVKTCVEGKWKTTDCAGEETCRTGKCRAPYTEERIAEILDASCTNAEKCYQEFGEYECVNNCNYFAIAAAMMPEEKTKESCMERTERSQKTYPKCRELYVDLIECRSKSTCEALKLCNGVDLGTEVDECRAEFKAVFACYNQK